MISRDTAVLPRKLDWLLTERIEEVKSIMGDNGTYIQVPPVGSQASLITVFGDHRVNIERTNRSIMALVRISLATYATLLTDCQGVPILRCVILAVTHLV